MNNTANEPTIRLAISEPSEHHLGPILIHDQDHNDIAEFFHNEHATVGQSYETALSLAKRLVGDPAQGSISSGPYEATRCDDGAWMVNTVGDIIASWPAPRFPDEDGGERNAKAIAAALNGAHAQGANDKDLGKHLGTYLGMSGIDAEDVAHIRAMLAPRTPAACARVANQPPAHWTGPSRWDRHPQTAEEWDAHKDPVGGKVEKAIRRINFAGDMTDPDAPDQMAIVHRWDLTTLMHELVFKRAAFDSHKETIEQLRALVENAARLQAAIESIPPHLNWLIGKGKTRPDEPPHAVQLLEDLKVVAQTEGDDLCAAIRDAIASLPHPSTSQELGR